MNRAWVGDITYIATAEGWLYLAAIIDLASRRVVGWAMSERIKADLVCEALRMAYWRRKPDAGLIMHTDRGSQYASGDYRKALDNCFILFLFQGTGGVNQAASGTQVREGPFDHLSLPRLKH